jgi:multiple sugar transport system substrate-binding protein
MRVPHRPPFARVALLAAAVACACAGRPPDALTISGSSLGAEGVVLRRQLARFEAAHPGIHVVIRITPDAADQRHQLYVQWLNAHVGDPDVLQLDTVWTAEFAAAGWIRPLPIADATDFLPAALEAARWRGVAYAVPWFVDVGLLYRRTDLAPQAPPTLAALADAAAHAMESGATRAGMVWQGARYEGLVTVFLEHLTAFGGAIFDRAGRIVVDQPPAVRALTFMRDAIWRGQWVPTTVLTAQEEQTRFAFQNGNVAFKRNWPYAWRLVQNGRESRVAGRVAVSPFPAAPGGRAAAALGGAELAINAFSEQPMLARTLIEFLTAPAQMSERAHMASQLPARRSVYDDPAIAPAVPGPIEELRRALDSAVPRPITPVYAELSETLQVALHRALSRQQEPDAALHDAADGIRSLLARSGLAAPEARQ